MTYKRARKGYTRKNLFLDIKDVLRDYKPKRIYTPHPLDGHPDHIASTKFLNLALDELKYEGKNNWIDKIEVFYYLIHNPSQDSRGSYLLSQEPNYKEDITKFKDQKQAALNEYRTQMSIKQEKIFLEGFIKDYELFWWIPLNSQDYLKQLEEEWVNIGQIMQSQGYNVNFAPVVDVADDIEDINIPLLKKRRIYSQDYNVIRQLALAVIKGMNREGVVPVIKHFPGLGRSYYDTHVWLPEIKVTKDELYLRDLAPFKELFKEEVHFWVMMSHAIYPCLSNKPATLSYEIQTGLLREELGFKGIIIVDELLVMQAIREYAFVQEMKEPWIGEIVCGVFQAGADIALFYVSSPSQAKEIISCIIEAVRKAIEEGRIKEQDIDASVMRILKEKERIFGVPLTHLFKDMPLEDKIAQKLITDVYCRDDDEVNNWRGVLKSYNIGGIHARDPGYIKEFQENSQIPLFITGQHEGGTVNQYGLNLYTRSAYLIGKEFGRLIITPETRPSSRFSAINTPSDLYNKQQKASFVFDKLDKAVRQDIIYSLLASMDELIGMFSELIQTGYISPSPNSLSPLIIHSDFRFELKPFDDLPIEWLRRFPNQDIALSAYQLFKEIFSKWPDSQGVLEYKPDEIILRLSSLKEMIEKVGGLKDKSSVRVLCLAAHPDDEDGEALAYLGKKFNCKTYILLATRGEGGENEMGSSLYEELGFLRMEEIEKAASILGVEKVYYLGRNDFGYCVDPKEAFDKWDRQETLEKLVYFYRLIRPHIIITRHNRFDTRDHCQHQALLVLAEEAFDLSADPQAYPEMIEEGLIPWQPLKFYQRLIGGKGNGVEIDPNEYISLEENTIKDIAFEALTRHSSQGDWQWRKSYNSFKIFYNLVKPDISIESEKAVKENSFFEGIQVDIPWPNVDGNNIGKDIPSGLPGVKMVNNLRVGLIEESDNILFIALKALGYDFKKLDEKLLKKSDLSQFDTIILGQGVYSAFPEPLQTNKHLLKFVKDGGNLIVFLQNNKESVFPYAPYPLEMSFNPICDEDAPIDILLPEHPLFNFPNKIYDRDFTGWVQDRGLVFPSQYSAEYTELLSCLFASGDLSKGGYLVTHYGKGSYIYTTYAWYRQLREFHIGAYRNLSNMLAYYYSK
ncbi:MAG: glycoside hydrolase family 3 N-terminal domain-containing protein [Candidatus Omnitrophota bacterium]